MASIDSIPLAVRSSNGISMRWGPPLFTNLDEFKSSQNKSCRTMIFSPNGKYFAFIDRFILKITNTETWTTSVIASDVKAYHLAFSPKSTYLVSWEQFLVTKEHPQGKSNLTIYLSETGDVVTSFVHKKQGNWEPQWSQDEKLFTRIVNNDVVFYENSNFEKVVTRINSFKIVSYCLSPNIGTYFVICHTPEKNGQPSFGRLFKYPDFNESNTVASKSFFQADKIEFYWNSKGNNVLLLTSTEVDKTGSSYYGKQGLYFMGVNGETIMLTMTKDGPIYSVAWSPKNTEFCIIYGFMPAKTTLFNLKCEPIFEFGTGPRNSIYYNPQGNLILLGGFGNLRGHIEIWDAMNRKKIGNSESPDSTLLQWAPDGIHFLTATTAPRLRIDNGYKIWHYSGSLLYELISEKQEELYDVCWKNYEKYIFKDPEIKDEKVTGIVSTQPVASKEAYRPPSARNRPPIIFKFDDDDNDNNNGISRPIHMMNQSKSSIKTKKKREAKRAKKLEESSSSGEPTIVQPRIVSDVQIKLSGDPEKDKKLKTIKKKLDAIEKLKQMQNLGQKLEINQIAKINAEDELLKELEQLQI